MISHSFSSLSRFTFVGHRLFMISIAVVDIFFGVFLLSSPMLVLDTLLSFEFHFLDLLSNVEF